LALDSAELGTWDYEFERSQLFADARTLALSGLPRTSGPHKREDFLERVHPAEREQVRRAQDELREGGSYHIEYRVMSGSEHIQRWLEARGKALLDRNEKPIRAIGVVHDVTERHRYDEFRRLLPGVIAHDLRSPLATVKMAGVALQKGALHPE